MSELNQKKGWVVAFAGFGSNLSLGVLYSWGMFAEALQSNYGWTATQTQIPYMVACAMFALLMVPGGRLQDKLGPKPVILTAAVLTAIGFLMSGLILTVAGLSIFFGMLFGAAIGFGYATTTPTAIKWFGAHKRGLISGIVVSGFGIASVYAAPLAGYLIEQFGLTSTFYILGAIFSIALFVFSRFMANPPADYVPQQPPTLVKGTKKTTCAEANYEWKEMVRTPQFYSLWLMFCFGALAGLLIIGQLRSIGIEQASLTPQWATALVVFFAVCNSLGRICCGFISDKLDRRMTVVSIFMIQVFTFSFFSGFTTPFTLFAGTAVVAFAYGGMLSLFPSITCDYFGVKNLGLNYGLVFTAWGAGGVFGPLLGGVVRDVTGTYNISYIVAVALSAVGILLALTTKAPSERKVLVSSSSVCPACGENIFEAGGKAG
ncbi:L-lactate MFS transporter [Dethiobacter alkaliphilus]|uniref:Major facilitator superfamily MFS_1 n=1 Tax=Dethiobacter alkaliphilus AHT 1 TaxID=555088 RepID=C0GEZ7_DETAL|nr:OFA family MFS transporter [Dethiobacter alkaliphilus]EEG78179.1 major facilitator superfamily MFS_1 [Dethiobacter alkaliphilus AHT 1]